MEEHWGTLLKIINFALSGAREIMSAIKRQVKKRLVPAICVINVQADIKGCAQ